MRETLKKEQAEQTKKAEARKAAKASAAAAKEKLAKESKAKLEKAALEKRKNAEDARRVEAAKKEADDRHEWEVVPRTGLIAKRKAGEAYKWADSVSRQLVMKDEVPRTSGDYRYAVVWDVVANTNETVCRCLGFSR